MKPYPHITREVDEGPSGSHIGAFFDFDGTLLCGFSVLFFLMRRYLSGLVSRDEALDQFAAMTRYSMKRLDFINLLTEFNQSMAGLTDDEMWGLAEAVFRKDLAGRLYPEARALINAHQEKGHTVVILSSATQYQLAFAADELDIDNVIYTRIEVEDGILTGRMVGPACYGEEKYRAAGAFSISRGLDLQKSYFYSDGSEDLPLLKAVGFPRPLNPDEGLTAVAKENNWPVRNFEKRGSGGVSDMIRTALVYGSFLPSFLVGAPAWLLNRSRRDVVNMGLSVWSDFASAVAGLKIDVSGEEHLWSHRPAVFVFNHQSATDVLIVGRLLRQDFTGITKKEMKRNPLLGPALTYADAVFIDRERNGDPAEAMRPALDKLSEGLSITIAPEGQRSPGYKLGAFKKGAFHIARQAGVPIIPIVIANSSDALPKSATLIRPATIRVTVLPPISTDDWTADGIDDQVQHCRNLFLRELGQWPKLPHDTKGEPGS